MDYVAELSDMGTILYPYYKGKIRGLEYGTGIWNQSKWRYDPFTGFVVPYKDSTAFVTYRRGKADVIFNAPDYNVKNINSSIPSRMSEVITINKEFTLRPIQKSVLNKILSDKEHNKWFINLQTGEGKTLLAIILAQMFGYKAFIMCFNTTILSQWASNLFNFTTINNKKILKLTTVDLQKIVQGDPTYEKYDIFMCTPGLLDRFGKTEKDYSKITKVFDTLGIGLSIYDEAHRNVGQMVKINALTNPKYRVFLSADFGQGNYEKDTQFKEIFYKTPVLNGIDEESAISMKYTKLVIVEFDSKPEVFQLKDIFRFIRGKYMYNANNYLEYQEKKGILNKSVYYVLDSIVNKDINHKILILYSNVSTVKKVGKYLKEKYPNINVGSFYGKVSPVERERIKNECQIIVATYSSFSTGVDAYNIKYVLSTNQCNRIEDNQSAGRARPLEDGSDAVYFMFIDNGFEYCRKKIKERLKYLSVTKSKNSKVYRISYDEGSE